MSIEQNLSNDQELTREEILKLAEDPDVVDALNIIFGRLWADLAEPSDLVSQKEPIIASNPVQDQARRHQVQREFRETSLPRYNKLSAEARLARMQRELPEMLKPAYHLLTNPDGDKD